MRRFSSIKFAQVAAWDNLIRAWRKAAHGKRGSYSVAEFEAQLGDHLVALKDELDDCYYQPSAYVHFDIHEPKRRRISAAPFRDRVVHHALCNLIEPAFEKLFIPHSYANRTGKGTHRAVDQFQRLCLRYRYCLRMDIVQHFAAIDHAVLKSTLRRYLVDPGILGLCDTIIDSGVGVLDQQYQMVHFPGDDLLATLRPRGLPIGNLTSQFWSNCYMHPFDQFVVRELRCPAYLRYVDDFALFGDDKRQLWEWKRRVMERLARLRLTIHEEPAQVTPVNHGIPWLGFIVYPTQRRLKGRKVAHARRRLTNRFDAWRSGDISFADFDASVQGWINHVRYADTWGLRKKMLKRFVR